MFVQQARKVSTLFALVVTLLALIGVTAVEGDVRNSLTTVGQYKAASWGLRKPQGLLNLRGGGESESEQQEEEESGEEVSSDEEDGEDGEDTDEYEQDDDEYDEYDEGEEEEL